MWNRNSIILRFCTVWLWGFALLLRVFISHAEPSQSIWLRLWHCTSSSCVSCTNPFVVIGELCSIREMIIEIRIKWNAVIFAMNVCDTFLLQNAHTQHISHNDYWLVARAYTLTSVGAHCSFNNVPLHIVQMSASTNYYWMGFNRKHLQFRHMSRWNRYYHLLNVKLRWIIELIRQ